MKRRMRLLQILYILTFAACTNTSSNKTDIKDSSRVSTQEISETFDNQILVDTPRILVAGRDYHTVATLPSDKVYFGDKFAPNKLEPYEIAHLELLIDSFIHTKKSVQSLGNKSLLDFKYNFYSVRTKELKLETRVVAFFKQKKFKSHSLERMNQKPGNICFSFIYNFTDTFISQYQFNEAK